MDVSTRRQPSDDSKYVVGNGNAGHVLGTDLKEYNRTYHEIYFSNGVAYTDPTMTEQVVAKVNELYCDKNTNRMFRYDGTAFIELTADTSGLAEKSYVDYQLALKANADTTYTKEEVDALVESAKPSDYDEVKERVSTLEAENAQQAKDIAMLKFANDGKTYIMEESDRDGYSVDVKPSTVTGEAFGEAVLKSMEGRTVVCSNLWNEEVEDGGYSSTGVKNSSSNSYRCKDLVPVMPSTGYTFVAPAGNWYINYYDASGSWVSYGGLKSGTFQFTTESNVHFVSFWRYNGGGASSYTHDVAVVKGTSGVYEPYYEGIHNNNVTEVRSEGKNLAEKSSVPVYSYNDDYMKYNPKNVIATVLEAGDYTFSADGRFYAQFFDSNNNNYDVSTILSGGASYVMVWSNLCINAQIGRCTFTLKVPCKVTFCGINDTIHNIQIEKGFNSNPKYTPYKPPVTLTLPSICSTLHGVGTARDKVSFVNDENGKRWLERKVGMVDIGSLSWSLIGSYYWVSSAITDAKRPASNGVVANILSSKYETSSAAAVSTSKVSIGLQSDGCLQAHTGDYSNHPTGTLHYELATPQLLDITDLVPEEPSLPIEDGGTLTFVNENRVATPSRISMPVKLGGTV